MADADERRRRRRLSRRLSQSQSAWPNTATTARARAFDSGDRDARVAREGRGGRARWLASGWWRGTRIRPPGRAEEREEDPGAIEGPLADGEEVLEYAPATRPLVPGLAVGGARDEAAGAEPAADRDAGPEPARRATHRGPGSSQRGTRRAMLVAVEGDTPATGRRGRRA